MSHRGGEDDDYNYSDDSFVSEGADRPSRKHTVHRKTTAPRKDDTRGKGRGKGWSKARSSNQTTPRVDPVVQRVLSARKLRINELRNNMEDLVKQIEDLRDENKLLKKTQHRQEKALNRFEDSESDLPQIMQRHSNEVRTMRDQLRKTKEKYDRTDRYLRDAEDELDKVKSKAKKYKQLVDENELLERDELSTKIKKAEIDMEEKDVRIKDLERHVNNLTKNHRHELGIEMARNRDSRKHMEQLQEENERLEQNLKEKVKELDLRNIYSNRMLGSRMLPNSYSGTPMRNQSPTSPRRRAPSVHDLSSREKVRLYEERRREEERKQREKRALKSKSTPRQRGSSPSPKKPVSTEPISSKKGDYSNKPWRAHRQGQSEKPKSWKSEKISVARRPFLYDDKKSQAVEKVGKSSWLADDNYRRTKADDNYRSTKADDNYRSTKADDNYRSTKADDNYRSTKADDNYRSTRTPSSRGYNGYNEEFERPSSAESVKEWEKKDEVIGDSYSKSPQKPEQKSTARSYGYEPSTGATPREKKWPWEKSGDEDTNNVSQKPPVGSTRIYASPPSSSSRYKSLGKTSTIASTPTYTGRTIQQKEREDQEAREAEEAKMKQRWEQMELARQHQEEREVEEREDKERRQQEREERERKEREEKDRQEAEEWKMKLERERMKREAEERQQEEEERQRRDRERAEQERRAEEERKQLRMDEQLAEERHKKDLLLAKLRDIDDGKKAEKERDTFFLTSKADSDVGSTTSSRKSYQFTRPVENLHEGKWSHEDVTIPYLEKQKKRKEKEGENGSYQPSFGRRGEAKKSNDKKPGEVVFNSDFAKPPKPQEKKKDLMANLFGKDATTKANNNLNDDIFSSSTFDKKQTNPAKLSLFDDEPKQTTNRENSLSLFGGGSALLDDELSPNDSSKLLPRRQRHTTTTFQSRPAVTAVDNYDDDIEEVIL